MGRFRFMEQILKIISFIVGAVISVLIFCDKDNKESSSHVKYKVSIRWMPYCVPR